MIYIMGMILFVGIGLIGFIIWEGRQYNKEVNGAIDEWLNNQIKKKDKVYRKALKSLDKEFPGMDMSK